MSRSGMASWQNELNWMDDDDEQDSDTDSKLSGSAVVDSMMKRLKKHGHYRDVTLDPISSLSEHEDEDSLARRSRRTDYHRVPAPMAVSNGYTDPSRSQAVPGRLGQNSPSRPRKKETLSPVPETSLGVGADVVGSPLARSLPSSTPGAHSMENLTPPQFRREDRLTGEMGARPYRQLNVKPMGMAYSHEAIPRPAILENRFASRERDGDGTHSEVGIRSTRSGSFGSGGVQPRAQLSPNYGRKCSGYEGVRLGHQTPPTRRVNYERHKILPRDYHGVDLPRDRQECARSDVSIPISQISMATREPNLNDVVDFLGSSDPGLVANAASYLQHLSYGDDSMKTKIREFGAIPVLVRQLRNGDSRVLVSVLGALKNLSYGRANDENKRLIAGDNGLTDIMLALRTTHSAEVRELLTGLLWNLSSCEDLKLRLLQLCLQELVEMIILPYSGWTREQGASPHGRPSLIRWNVELRNVTGCLRNASSAGEAARVMLRSATRLVDCLIWLAQAGVQQRQTADEKVVENVVCILRNLSYRLESEVDTQAGSDDCLDPDWEREQRSELDEEGPTHSPGCLAFCARPRTSDRSRATSLASKPVQIVNFADPDVSALPRRHAPVMGVALLWQPEVVYLYLAVMEQYSSCHDALEGAAGAVQNLTACSWKWSVYSHNLIRSSNGLRVVADLLDNSHDAVVRAAAKALRNLAHDPRSKSSLGVMVIPVLVTRLPFSSNHLGISEPTTVSLLCCLMELCAYSPENAKLFREREGIYCVARLSRSRQHTAKIAFAASKVCLILHGFKDCRPVLRQEGWDPTHHQRLVRENDFSLDSELGSISRDYHGASQRKKGSRKEKGPRKEKKSSRKDKSRKKQGSRREHGGGEAASQPSPYRTAPRTPQPLPQPPAETDPTEEIIDPFYSLISTPGRPAEPPANPTPSPLGIYQTIGDAQLTDVRSSSRTGQSEATAPSSVSAPLSQDEPDPNATYAQVDMDKKRASRRIRETSNSTPSSRHHSATSVEAVDSWV